MTSLRAAIIVVGPDGLVYDCWLRPGLPLTLERLADACRALLSGRRESLSVLGQGDGPSVLLLDSDDVRVVLSDLSTEIAAAFVFDGDQPLGLVSAVVRELSEDLADTAERLSRVRATGGSSPDSARAPSQAAPRNDNRPG